MAGRLVSFYRAIPFFVVLGLGLGSFWALSSMRKPPETRLTSGKAPTVTTAEVVSAGASLELDVEGEVVPFREVTLSAEVAGRIQKKSAVCRAGHYVHQDCLLLQIDPSDYDLEIRRIQQSIKAMEVSVEESDVELANNKLLLELAKSDIQLQEKELKRVETLLSQRVTSQAALDTARRAQIQAQNAVQLRENQARLIATRRGRFLREKDQLLVQLDKAELDRQRTEMRAPVSGILMDDMVEQDDFVQRGTPVVKIEDTSQVEVNFDLKFDELRWIWGGPDSSALTERDSYTLPPLPVQVRVDVQGRPFVWDAVLARYDGSGINPATRTVPCVAVVQNPRGGRFLAGENPVTRSGPPALFRGMFVTVTINVPTDQALLEIPVRALRPDHRVWISCAGNLAVRDVQIAQVLVDRVLLFPDQSQVSAGDRVVVSPLPLAVDGMEIADASGDSFQTRTATSSSPATEGSR